MNENVEAHQERMNDALAHLRSLSSDDERVKALERYGRLKFSLANELWSGGVPPLNAGLWRQAGLWQPQL